MRRHAEEPAFAQAARELIGEAQHGKIDAQRAGQQPSVQQHVLNADGRGPAGLAAVAGADVGQLLLVEDRDDVPDALHDRAPALDGLLGVVLRRQQHPLDGLDEPLLLLQRHRLQIDGHHLLVDGVHPPLAHQAQQRGGEVVVGFLGVVEQRTAHHAGHDRQVVDVVFGDRTLQGLLDHAELRNPLRARHLQPGELRHVQALEVAFPEGDGKPDRAAAALERLHQLRAHHLVGVKIDHAARVGVDARVGVAVGGPGVGHLERHAVEQRRQVGGDFIGDGREALVLLRLGRLFDEHQVAAGFVPAQGRSHQKLERAGDDRVALHPHPLLVDDLARASTPAAGTQQRGNGGGAGTVQIGVGLVDFLDRRDVRRSPSLAGQAESGQEAWLGRSGDVGSVGHTGRVGFPIWPPLGSFPL